MHARHSRVLAGLALTAVGCAGGQRPQLEPPQAVAPRQIVQLDLSRPDSASVLREVAGPVVPGSPEVERLLGELAATLEASGGVGIAAPQIGVPLRVILVRHGTRPVGGRTWVKAYLNPVLEWSSEEQDEDYEGCLSVDGVGGKVQRPRAIRFSFDPPAAGPRETLELADWDARIAQHELDHLDGVLYVDKVIGELLSTEEARRRREELHRARGWLGPPAAAESSAP